MVQKILTCIQGAATITISDQMSDGDGVSLREKKIQNDDLTGYGVSAALSRVYLSSRIAQSKLDQHPILAGI